MKKYLVFLIFFSFQFNLLAQKVELSPNQKYYAVCFQNLKDSVVFINYKNYFEEKLVTFAKYKISIFDARTSTELYSQETRIFQLNNKTPNVKLSFDKNSQYLYAAIENKEVFAFNTEKGFSAKYKAQDFCFNSSGTELTLLELDKISANSETIVKRKLESFTDIKYTSDDQFIVVSRKLKNRIFSIFIEVANTKNTKSINAEVSNYNPEDREIKAFKSTKILSYKTPSFKNKESGLSKQFLNKSYKKNSVFAKFNSEGHFLVLQSDAFISILSGKGKGIVDLKKEADFIEYSWVDKATIEIVSESKIQYYNITTKVLSEEGNLSFKTSNKEIKVEKGTSSSKFYSKNSAALNTKKGFFFKNTASNQQIYFENETFLNFSKNESYLFTKTNEQEINVREVESIFTKKQPLKLKTEKIRLLSTLGGSYFLKKTISRFHSPDLKTIATVYNETSIDTTFHSNVNGFEWVYNEIMVNKNAKIDTNLNSGITFIQGSLLFNTEELNSKNFPITQQTYNFIEHHVNIELFNNPMLLGKHKENLRLKYFREKTIYTIEDLRISNKKTLIIKHQLSNQFKIVDVRKNEELIYLENGNVFFSPDNSFIIVETSLKTILYNAIAGHEIRSYDTIYSDILLSNDTSFFIGKNPNSDYEFIGLKKQQNLNTSIVKMTENGKYLFVLNKKKTEVKLYSLPELNEISSNTIDEKYKKYFYNPEIEISENGSYFSSAYKNKILVLSTKKGDNKQVLLKNLSNNPAYWVNDEEFIVPNEESNLLFNVSTEVFSKDKDFNFYFSESILNELKGKSTTSYVSKNAKFAALQFFQDGESKLFVKNTSEKYKKHVITNASFIAFDEKSERLYFKRGVSKISFIELSPLLENPKELVVKSIKAARTRSRNLPPRPSVLANDFPAPDGYHYERFVEVKSINDREEELGMYAFSLISKGNSVNLNVHLLDEEGVFYASSTKEKDKDIWCELWIKYPDGSTKRLEHFDVSESSSSDENNLDNYALSLVLDHSGSMGSSRCLYQQKGVKAFIEKKRQKDAISVLKFDENVNTEILLNDSKTELLSTLVIDGGKKFGGSTALYDGIYEGITEVSKAKGQKKQKAVIVITDGYENSSYTYLNELILYALENNVQVHTIGFGLFVNKPVLQTIAYQTGGSFYEIYDTKNFSWIFNDVFNKLANHYTVNFATPQKGKYTIMLKSCSDKIKNNIVLAFDNDEINYGQIKEYGDNGFGIPFMDLSDSITVSVFEKNEPIPNLDKIISKNGSNLDYYTEKEFEGIEFPDIKFITDKTVVIKGTDNGLDDVILFLKKHPRIIIEISGHTDNVGTETNNLLLSANRAKKVKAIIVKAGVDKNRILTIGYGESKAIATNETKEGKMKNRRVEFRIVK